MKFDAIVIGVSAGGLHALTHILQVLPAQYPIPVIVVQHRAKDERALLEEVLQNKCRIRIIQANEKEPIEPGTVYLAPPDYHLLVETNRTFSLTFDAPVNYSRPSVDVLFETAADVFTNRLLGIVLTGANRDGAKGVQYIQSKGGLTIAQEPATADFPEMPMAAIKTGAVQHIMHLDEIKAYLLSCVKKR
jgi:Chemotaxis response regulator containing a CheY-like receiver domain and a methylesterase domain